MQAGLHLYYSHSGNKVKFVLSRGLASLFYLFYLFIYSFFNEGKTHLANIKVFYHVVLGNKLVKNENGYENYFT